jgi:hypothetical protein
MSNSSESKFLFRGVWWTIHIMALSATNISKAKSFADMIDVIAENFFCEECKPHIQNYLRAFHSSNFLSSIDENGMFSWSFLFHNAVNSRIGKPILSFEEALFKMKSNCSNCLPQNSKKRFTFE